MKTKLLAGISICCLLFQVISIGQNRVPVAIPDRLDLPTVLNYALQNNFSILQAQQRIREQEGLIVEIRSQALPEATLNANYNQIDSGLSETFGGLFDPNTENWNIALNVRQALYKGGGVRAALRVQNLLEEAILYDLKAAINLAVLDVKTRFYDVLLARESIGVQEQNIELLDNQLRDAKNRFEAGAVSQFEVLRAEVERANSQPELIRARNGFRIAIEELRQVMGFTGVPEDAHKYPEFVGSLEFTPSEVDLVRALEIARANRPELQQLQLIVEAREEGIVIERAGNRPDVDLVGSYQFNKSTVSNSFGNALNGWTIGIQSSWAIFDGRSTEGKVLQAKSQLEQARLDLGQTTLEVEVEVRRAIHQLQQASELAQASSKVIDQAAESLRLANEIYAAGGGTQLDVLQSQVALTESRLNQVEAFHGYNVALVTLSKALGNAIPYEQSER
ncbi:MAG: TolC family protein [Verrucomicrobia bacterium]|nr:TolC family protein [Verrucomicrobiota bacterium]MDA1065751.1 TolC family protein [Verrucomicrobiota bacterium]